MPHQELSAHPDLPVSPREDARRHLLGKSHESGDDSDSSDSKVIDPPSPLAHLQPVPIAEHPEAGQFEEEKERSDQDLSLIPPSHTPSWLPAIPIELSDDQRAVLVQSAEEASLKIRAFVSPAHWEFIHEAPSGVRSFEWPPSAPKPAETPDESDPARVGRFLRTTGIVEASPSDVLAMVADVARRSWFDKKVGDAVVLNSIDPRTSLSYLSFDVEVAKVDLVFVQHWENLMMILLLSVLVLCHRPMQTRSQSVHSRKQHVCICSWWVGHSAKHGC
eukprot:GABV01008780.1.p1 GENE.GABV01008780.1~~GABV01008780.1.p1  ORF type:complete len:276 (-),score=45.74 GABV01008780.1:109-936(-)